MPEGSTTLSAAAGYFVMVKPLPVGRHTIHFGGAGDFRSTGGTFNLQDITYYITVVPADDDDDDD